MGSNVRTSRSEKLSTSAIITMIQVAYTSCLNEDEDLTTTNTERTWKRDEQVNSQNNKARCEWQDVGYDGESKEVCIWQGGIRKIVTDHLTAHGNKFGCGL